MNKYSKVYNAMYYCIHNRCNKCPYSNAKTPPNHTCHDTLMKDTLRLLDKVGELMDYCYADIEGIDDVYDQL